VFYYLLKVLQHSGVKLTWDDDDPDRVKIIRRKFTKKDVDDRDFKAYIASSSEESDENAEETKQKYKNLLNETENDNAEGQEMEITFTPGLSETAALNSEKDIENETSLETYLRKLREKRKERKAAKMKEMKNTSDDDIGRNLNDLSSKSKSKLSKEEREKVDQQKAELELLVMDSEEEGHRHFDMKEIIKNEKRKGKKKKKGEKRSR